MKKIIISTIIGMVILFLIIQVSIIRTPYKQVPKKSDVIIVLGCRLWGDRPSPMLTYRLEKALALYNEGYAESIIVSGSQGEDEWITEALAMKNYLVDKGVPPEMIFKEENSFSTYQNLYYSREIMSNEEFESAIIVTNSFHIHRSLMLANRLNIDAVGGPAMSHPNPFLIIKYYTREVVAYMKDLLLSF
ncbi:YdcF family protein [Natronincola ferrireducens]|uniref:Protein SanA, affects membrane permeability for vancomycin n=1 Tax=Natronincola ferrireducens TaxID=393762 RepID=A0A1G9ABG0_9FIRM|nr:YdcF family protein [Natronincola ferrireducens]SDK24699.1 protein SanA, affects membrane permeability for vancomycin [Natronincola ferrireducens]